MLVIDKGDYVIFGDSDEDVETCIDNFGGGPINVYRPEIEIQEILL